MGRDDQASVPVLKIKSCSNIQKNVASPSRHLPMDRCENARIGGLVDGVNGEINVVVWGYFAGFA